MLRMLQREQEQLMDGECLITAESEGHMDDDGVWHPAGDATVYEGPCLARPAASATRTVESAGGAVELHAFEVKVPVDGPTTPVERGHVVKITASRDPQMVGRYFVVRAVEHDEWLVDRNLVCTEGRS